MALENGDYINQLDEAAPDGLDPKSQGDDHLRLIKKVLKRTFPNITGAVSATQAQLNALLALGTIPSRGMIQMWFGERNAVPAGWLLCDGNNGTPNLLNRFVMGAGAPGINQGATGGTENHTHAVGVTTTVVPHALTLDQIPSHQHGVYATGNNTSYGRQGTGSGPGDYLAKTDLQGGGAPHTHGVSSSATIDARSHIPPYLALWYIMKA